MRAELRRIVPVDAAVALALGAACLVAAAGPWGRPELHGRIGGPDRGMHDLPGLPFASPSLWVVPAVGVLMAGVALRRVWPRVGFVLTVSGVAGFVAAGAVLGPALLAPALAVYAMAVAHAPQRWVPLTALLVPMILARHWREPYLGVLYPALYADLLTAGAVAVVPAMIALLRRSRREAELEVRETERRRYAYEERLRIAREVHDVVGHSLSVISMQAGVALHLLQKQHAGAASPAGPVDDALEAIRRTSREALAELRTTLDVFRADPDEPRAPLPGLGRLDGLVSALRAAGRPVQVVREPPPPWPPLPAAVDQAAFRIVQESLTNVARHAGPAEATVRLVRAPDHLSVEVFDDGPTTRLPAEGNGIRGMAERARAVGGTVRLALRRPTGLAVTAELPLDQGAAG